MEEQKIKATKALFDKAQNKIDVCSETVCYEKVIKKIEGLLGTGAFFCSEGPIHPPHIQFGIKVEEDYVDIGRYKYDYENGVEFTSVMFLEVLISDIKRFIETTKLYFINKYSKVEVDYVEVTQLSTTIDIKIIGN